MISAVVLTNNSSKTLGQTLDSLKFCNEIIAIDDYSTDTTEGIAKKHNAKLFKRKLDNDFAKQRNFGLSKAKYDWVLFIDSDEIVNRKLANEILKKVKDDSYFGYLIPRVDVWLKKNVKHGEVSINLLRLGRKNSGVWSRKVHEVWNIEGKIGLLKNKILHYPHSSVYEFVKNIGTYSEIHARENKAINKKPLISKIVLMPIMKFKINYFLRQGYKDGMHGFVIAGIMSFHSFLGWSNLWLNSRKKKY